MHRHTKISKDLSAQKTIDQLNAARAPSFTALVGGCCALGGLQLQLSATEHVLSCGSENKQQVRGTPRAQPTNCSTAAAATGSYYYYCTALVLYCYYTDRELPVAR
jgi:hypothetical protein